MSVTKTEAFNSFGMLSRAKQIAAVTRASESFLFVCSRESVKAVSAPFSRELLDVFSVKNECIKHRSAFLLMVCL